MSVVIQKKKTRLKNKVAYSVRASQAVLQYGVGAMVDFRDRTLMTAAPEYWGDSIAKIRDERLEKILHVDYFGKPVDKVKTRDSSGMSYVRFPEWYFCPSCRKFKPIKEWVSDFHKYNSKRAEDDPDMIQTMRCSQCSQELVVARIVVACTEGHIDDFPWVKWVHCRNFGGNKPVCHNPELTISTSSGASEGLEGLTLKCLTCGAQASLRGAFDKDIFQKIDKESEYEYDFHCTGRHPWKHCRERCKNSEYPKVMQRGSSSVYFPVTECSLVIPPYSSIVTSKIQESDAFDQLKIELANLIKDAKLYNESPEITEAKKQSRIRDCAQKIAQETAIPIEKVESVLRRKSDSTSEEEYSTASVKYRAEEYEAIAGETVVTAEDYGEFLREGMNIEDYDLPFLKSISLIHKVREVQALIGFTRLKPVDNSDVSESQGIVVSVKDAATNWYPASEVRGEGIFLEFDEEVLNQWRTGNSDLAERVSILNENYKKSFIGENHPREITGKYLLLHTISHLLIKQLSFECGYGIASLKERIYCSEAAEGKVMSGILIYTASGDSEGTLGGLVRQGRPDTFPQIFKKAIENAKVCSNDPVCSLSQGQGRDSLNLAACYSCALIPETSCEAFNSFLDRGVVVGTFDKQNLGFFCRKYKKEERSPIGFDNDTKESLSALCYGGKGSDLSNHEYSDIWSSLLSWSGSKTEKRLLKELYDCSQKMNEKMKPVMNGVLVDSKTGEEYCCDLIWIKPRIVYLSAENNDLKEIIERGGWTCLCGSDEELSAEHIIEMIPEV